jgi:hypothetical protein
MEWVLLVIMGIMIVAIAKYYYDIVRTYFSKDGDESFNDCDDMFNPLCIDYWILGPGSWHDDDTWQDDTHYDNTYNDDLYKDDDKY